jgi:hypothetical protein
MPNPTTPEHLFDGLRKLDYLNSPSNVATGRAPPRPRKPIIFSGPKVKSA